ncbi:MAG: retroviral-like aspartic protease family protein [Oscillospiraceae bacterium]|nr:retroviral-like aspartic protease family protein [Oscillospiraceae bacterium]
MVHEVRINTLGFVILRVYIRHKDKPIMLHADYKVDTGANCTTIGVDWLFERGYDEPWVRSGTLLEGNARPTVASGLFVEDCYRVILPEIRIGEWVGYNWPVITSLSEPFKFLLGTDSLRFFTWHFDYENNICRFDLISGKRKLQFNEKEQSIHAIDESNLAHF